MSRYWGFVKDDEGLHVNIRDEDRSTEEGANELQRSRAEDGSENLRHCSNLCGVLPVVGETNDRNSRAQVQGGLEMPRTSLRGHSVDGTCETRRQKGVVL